MSTLSFIKNISFIDREGRTLCAPPLFTKLVGLVSLYTFISNYFFSSTVFSSTFGSSFLAFSTKKEAAFLLVTESMRSPTFLLNNLYYFTRICIELLCHSKDFHVNILFSRMNFFLIRNSIKNKTFTNILFCHFRIIFT